MGKIEQNLLVKKVGFNRIVLIVLLILMYLAFGHYDRRKFLHCFTCINEYAELCIFPGISFSGRNICALRRRIELLDWRLCSVVHGCSYSLTTYGVRWGQVW